MHWFFHCRGATIRTMARTKTPTVYPNQDFSGRVEFLRDKAGSISALAEATGVSYSAIRHYLAGGEPSLGALIRLADGMECPLEWLARGGPLVNGNPHGVKGVPLKFMDQEIDSSVGRKSSSQGIANVGDRGTPLQKLRASRYINTSAMVIVKLQGDSMEPTFVNGALLIVKDINNASADDVYVISFNGRLTVKRILFLNDGGLRVISDNPAYERYTLAPTQAKRDVEFYGRVIGQFFDLDLTDYMSIDSDL